jgi:hypothetical protein
MAVALFCVLTAAAGLFTVARSTTSQAAPGTGAAARSGSSTLPAKKIERIEQAQGSVSGGVLSINIDRSSYHVTAPDGVKFKPGFQIEHQLYFQMLSPGTAMFNGDVAIKSRDIQPVIDAIHRNHLVFQAEHQHFTDATPQIWFVHFRGTGAPTVLAREVHRVVVATHVSLPQTMPKHPKTRLPAKQLGAILGGTATVGAFGVVDVEVDRTDTIRLGGHPVEPGLGVMTDVQFQPTGSGDQAIVVPDFAMKSSEVNPVTRLMRAHHWDVECLYNQEIGESPQLYFSHMFKRGDARDLARQIRNGLDRTASQRS